MQKILIVEDDLLAAELERDYLEVSGYEVELCSNGEEGYRKAMSGKYNLLLLDIMLPGMSGFEICWRIRRIQHIPIIMVTAKTEDVDMIRGLGLGADDYIMKPFNPAELVARVKAHIRIHELLLEESGAEEQEIRHRERTGNSSFCISLPPTRGRCFPRILCCSVFGGRTRRETPLRSWSI